MLKNKVLFLEMALKLTIISSCEKLNKALVKAAKTLPFYKYFNTKHGFIDVADTSNAAEGPVGEVSVQVDLKTHPGTGESKITIKGLCKKP